MKKILFLIILFLSLFGIYKAFDNPKLNYISIGDSLINGINPYNNMGYGYNDYVKNYLERNNKLRSFNNYYYNNSLKGLTEDIKNNRTIMVDDKEYFLKKILRESDIIVVSSGMDELSFNYQEDDMKYNYQYFDKMYNDIEELILELKKYSINDIIFNYSFKLIFTIFFIVIKKYISCNLISFLFYNKTFIIYFIVLNKC